MKALLPKLLFSTLILILSTFFVQAACTASFTKSISGLTVTFTNTSTTTSGFPNMMMYTWNFGDGTYSTVKNPVKTYTTAGVKNVQLTINDSFGCIKTVIDTFLLVSSSSACNANFGIAISGHKVTLYNMSTNANGLSTGLSYYWQFADSTTSTLKDPVKLFSSNGSKSIKLTISDSSQGCFDTFEDSALLVSQCASEFTIVKSGLTVSLINTSLNADGTSTGLSYEWNFGDATSSNLKNPVKTYATPGLKTMSLLISDSIQGCYAVRHDTITLIATSCVANFTKTTSALTVNLTNTSINTNGSSAGLSYYWSFSDGTSSTLKNPTKVFSTGGYKTINLTITDTLLGCLSTKMDSVNLPSPLGCIASFTTSVSGLTVSFNNTSTSSAGMSNVHYSWYFSNGQHSTLTNPVTTFLAPGMQVAELTMYDSTTHCSSFFRDSILAVSPNNSCAASFIKSATGNTVVLTNMSTNTNGLSTGLSYYWYFSDGTSSSLKHPTKVFTTNGLKTISLTITDSTQGCFSTKVDSVMLPSGCAPSFNISVSGLTVTFTNTSVNGDGTANGLSYEWHFTHDNTNYTSKNLTKTFPSIGYFPVRLSISDPAQGCLAKIHDTITLSSSSACTANFSKSVSGFTVNLTNASLNTNGSPAGLSYYWYFSDGTSSTLKDPVKIFTSPGLKTIQLTISDSTQSCFASVSDTVYIAPALPICQASFSLAVDTSMPFHFFILNTSVIQPGSTFFWDFGDGTSSTSMTPTHTYATFGPRYVCLTVSHSLCTSTFCDTIGMDSNGMLLKKGAFGFHTLDYTTVSTTTATSEITTTPEYTIYPNPSNSDVFVDYTLQSATLLNIEVTDITGKVVISKQANGLSGKHTETIDIRDLQPAIYFMTIRTADMQKNYKLIKN